MVRFTHLQSTYMHVTSPLLRDLGQLCVCHVEVR